MFTVIFTLDTEKCFLWGFTLTRAPILQQDSRAETFCPMKFSHKVSGDEHKKMNSPTNHQAQQTISHILNVKKPIQLSHILVQITTR